jgi:antitoxin component YwqK of YwqJK toxin-antitoxin module
MKMRWIILLFVAGLISCTEEIVMTETEIGNDLLYTKDNVRPYTGKCKVVYPNTEMVKEVLTFRKGRLNGDALYYYRNGNIKWKGCYKDGFISGRWEYWDENGKIMYVVNYKNDTLDGEFKSFHSNGLIKEKGCYLNNSRTGEWIVYSEKGKIDDKKSY